MLFKVTLDDEGMFWEIGYYAPNFSAICIYHACISKIKITTKSRKRADTVVCAYYSRLKI